MTLPFGKTHLTSPRRKIPVPISFREDRVSHCSSEEMNYRVSSSATGGRWIA